VYKSSREGDGKPSLYSNDERNAKCRCGRTGKRTEQERKGGGSTDWEQGRIMGEEKLKDELPGSRKRLLGWGVAIFFKTVVRKKKRGQGLVPGHFL